MATISPATPAISPENHTLKHSHPSHSQLPHNNQNNHAILSSTSILIILLCSISLVILLAIFFIIVMLRRLKSGKKAKRSTSFRDNGSINHTNNDGFSPHTAINFTSSPDVNGGCLYGQPLMNRGTSNKYKGVQVYTYKELEVATERFSEGNKIANGGYGVVYKGVLCDGTLAAIKKLHREGKLGERAFRIEVDLLSRLHSPYLVQLLGYCADQHHRLLVFEFMPNGNLQQHLHQRQFPPLDWPTRLRIALDCSRALEFLHEHANPSVIHRDFKCSNILLDSNFRAKLSDFGLAKTASDKTNGQISTRVLGTTGYLAPEYASTGKLTTKSDVYNYGVVLLQLLTGRTPVDTKRPSGEHVLISWALPRLTNREKIEEMVDPAINGQFSKKDLIQVAAIAAMCVQPEADYRPLITDVVQSLLPIVKNLNSAPSSRFINQILSPNIK